MVSATQIQDALGVFFVCGKVRTSHRKTPVLMKEANNVVVYFHALLREIGKFTFIIYFSFVHALTSRQTSQNDIDQNWPQN